MSTGNPNPKPQPPTQTPEEAELEKRRAAIIVELEKLKAVAKAKDEDVFNNLWMKMPGKDGKKPMQMMYSGVEETLNDPITTQIHDGESELSTRTSYNEFFKMVDEIVATLQKEGKLKKGELELVIEDELSRKIPDWKSFRIRRNKLLEFVYIELRLKGFSHYDLWK